MGNQQRERKKAVPGRVLERVPGYLSVHEAAQMLGVSERSVYGYIEEGKVQAWKAGTMLVVNEQEILSYERQPAGRKRLSDPRWHIPAAGNAMEMTTITARVRPGQSCRLERLLTEMRQRDRHRIPGTAARYIVRNQVDEEEIEMVLIWRSLGIPSEQEREVTLTALLAEFADVLDWKTLQRTQGRVLLHA